MDDFSDSSTLQRALEEVIGETATEAAMEAREATTANMTEGQVWVLCVAVLIVAAGGFVKNMRGGPIQLVVETWREDRQFKREVRREVEERYRKELAERKSKDDSS